MILFLVMTPSNEVLSATFDMMIEQNNKEHSEIKEMITSLSNDVRWLPKEFVTRIEFRAVSRALWLLATWIGIAAYFLWK